MMHRDLHSHDWRDRVFALAVACSQNRRWVWLSEQIKYDVQKFSENSLLKGRTNRYEAYWHMGGDANRILNI